MHEVAITGTGLFVPPHSISNEELVESFNKYVELFNHRHSAEIEAGETQPLEPSSVPFVEKASGIKNRYAMDKDGILDPERMMPNLGDETIGDDEVPALMAQMALDSAQEALQTAGISGADLDLVIASSSALQRYYPAISIEVQHHLGAKGFAYDMQVACSAATFALSTAVDMIRAGSVRRALVVNPEICTAHLNFKDRDSHFIFGDVCTATVLERADETTSKDAYRVISTKTFTQYSNNIRNNLGILALLQPERLPDHDMRFMQEGRKVFKELLPLVCTHITDHLGDHELVAPDLRRMWLHQANINMNLFAARKLLGRNATADEAPIVLDEFANTASAGSLIAFHRHRDDIVAGDKGLICSFGAGYSVGSLLVEKMA